MKHALDIQTLQAARDTAEAAAVTVSMPPPAPRPQQMGPRVQGAPTPAPVDGEDDSEDDEEDEEEDLIIADGRFSPPPMDIALIAGQEVMNEEDDYRWANCCPCCVKPEPLSRS